MVLELLRIKPRIFLSDVHDRSQHAGPFDWILNRQLYPLRAAHTEHVVRLPRIGHQDDASGVASWRCLQNRAQTWALTADHCLEWWVVGIMFVVVDMLYPNCWYSYFIWAK